MIIGIDPGANGAAICLGHKKAINVFRFKKFDCHSWYELGQFLDQFKYYDPKVYMEAVSAMPRDAKSTAFTFGKNTGIILGVIYTALEVTPTEVHSQKWQRHFGLGAKFESKTARKNAQKAKAQELFPNIKVTLDIADALLIAQYGYDTVL